MPVTPTGPAYLGLATAAARMVVSLVVGIIAIVVVVAVGVEEKEAGVGDGQPASGMARLVRRRRPLVEFGHGRPPSLVAKGIVEGGDGRAQSGVGRDSDPVVVRRRGGSSGSGPVGVGVPSGEDGGGDTVGIDGGGGGDSISSSTKWWWRRYRSFEFGLELGSEALDLGLGLGLGIAVQKPSYLGEGETALLPIVACTLIDSGRGRRRGEASDGIPAGCAYLGLGDGETTLGLVTRGGVLVDPGEWGGSPIVGYPQEGGTTTLWLLLTLGTLLNPKL